MSDSLTTTITITDDLRRGRGEALVNSFHYDLPEGWSFAVKAADVMRKLPGVRRPIKLEEATFTLTLPSDELTEAIDHLEVKLDGACDLIQVADELGVPIQLDADLDDWLGLLHSLKEEIESLEA